MTEHDVAVAGLASRAKLWRIESGRTATKIGDVRALCWLYKVDQATTDALAHLAQGTSAKGWWEEYSDVLPDWFWLYAGLADAASEIRTYNAELVHGLLQTPNYMRTLFASTRTNELSEDAIQRRIEARQQRQRAVTIHTPPLRITAILNAGVLARVVGGKAVMDEQVNRLRELNQLDHVDIRVLPWGAGAHTAMDVGAFSIFDFPDPDDPAVVYLEGHTAARYLERPEDLAEYRTVFNLVYEKTIPLEEYP